MPLEPLTKLQREVLPLVLSGMTCAEVAESLGLTPGCIRTTCHAIRAKGYRIPCFKRPPPSDAMGESEHRARERERNKPTSRFSAAGKILRRRGRKPIRISVTADSQEFADAHLAALLGDG